MENYNWKLAIRNLLKQKRASILNIIGLAFALTFVVLICLFVVREFTYDTFHMNADRIFKPEFIYSLPDQEAGKSNCLSLKEIDLLRESIPGIKSVSFLNYSRWDWDNGAWIEYNGNKFNLERLAFSDKYFPDIFTFKAKWGNLATALDDPNSLVLTSEIAEKIFGAHDPIGKTVLLNNKSIEIKAVLEPIPSNSSIQFSGLVSYQSAPYFFGDELDDYSNIPFVLTNEELSLSSIEESISSAVLSFIINEYIDEEIPTLQTTLVSIKDLYYHEANNIEPIKHGKKTMTFIVLAIGLIILFLAIINYINLSLATSVKWNRQAGVQLILGAGKNASKKQLFIKGFFISFAAFIISLVLINLFLPWFNKLVNFPLVMTDILSIRFIITSVSILVFIIIISGFIPSFLFKKSTVIIQVKGEYRTFIGNGRIWKYLVVFQLFISISLICAAMMISKQIHFALHKDIGLTTKNVITLPLSKLGSNKAAFLNSLENNPQTISHCFSTSYLNTQNVWGGKLMKPGKEPEQFEYYTIRSDERFLPTLGFELIEGRNFHKNSGSDVNAYIINETALKVYNIGDPLNTTINGNPIVGVIKDFNYNSIRDKIEPVAIWNTPDYIDLASIRFRAGTKEELRNYMNFLQKEWESLSDEAPFEYEFLDQRLEKLYTDEIKLMKTIISFSVLSVFIACLGLFGLLSYIMEIKTKEIGIRKINGAKTFEILKFLNTDLLKWLAAAFILATPIVWYCMFIWLENFAYKTKMNWWVFAASGFIAFIIALLTISWQSFRTARKNPVEALRYE